MTHFRLFCRGFVLVSLVAANTRQIAAGNYLGAFIVGTLISAVWFGNSRSAAHTDLKYAREAYSMGAGLGTIFGMWIVTHPWL